MYSDLLREAKEDLLARGLTAQAEAHPAVPSQIERSWRRCMSQGVRPDILPSAVPSEPDRDEPLIRAAQPVLEKLCDDLTDLGVAVVLGDAAGTVIDRFTPSARELRWLDMMGTVLGSNFSESSLGTNGLGSVFEERSPVYIRGAEHFLDAFEGVSCTGVPIFEPGTRKIRGCLSLTTATYEGHPMMLTLTHAAVRDIERRLLDSRSRDLQDLASAFAAASRGNPGALAMLTPSTVLANSAGLPYMIPTNHAIIWEALVSPPIAQSATLRVELASGAVDLRADRLNLSDEDLAFQVAISAPRRSRSASLGPARMLHPLQAVNAEIAHLSERGGVAALVGPVASGKAHSARLLCASIGAEIAEIAAPGTHPSTEPWDRSANSALSAGKSVLLRHLDTWSADELSTLRDVLDRANNLANTRARVIVTLDDKRASADLIALVRSTASVVRLPGIAAMRTAIPTLVESIVAESPTARPIFQSAALQALSRRDWPGNIGELRRVVLDLCARAPGVVREADLPPITTAADHDRGSWERTERATILDALREANGNRAKAARILGIGRTTLYRKLRSLRIDTDDVAG